MRTTSFILASGFAAIAAAAKIDLSSVKLTTSYQTVPGAYLVELDNLSSLGGKRSLDAHSTFYSALKKRGLFFDIRKEFHGNDFFTGVSLNLHNDEDVKALADISGIKSIYPVQILPRPAPIKSHVVSGPSDAALPKDVFSTHKMTGVDKLHNEGHFGEGIKIGVIDSGIDYNHPSLGGGFGPGHKVAFGHDFVGDDYNGGNTPVPDEDPMDCNSHGTHVSGIVAADGNNPYNLTGVAPKATLGGYRVFGCTGGVGDDVLLDAMIRAYNDGCDVITMSLGGPAGWTESPSAVVASKIAKAGRVVTIAAGNEGAYGAWYSAGPATAIDAISVASIENTVVIVQNATVSDGYGPVPYFSFLPLKIDGAKEIYAVSTDTTVPNDACNPLPDSTPDLSDKLVLIRRGSCSFVQKLDNVAAKGAKQALIYNNVPTALSGITVGNYTAALISDVDGAYLVNQFKAGKKLTISFPQQGGEFDYPSPQGGLVSTFSTYGPSNDMYFKAAVAAPGGNILSTYPVKLGSWAVESGTSMATPFVAGSAALVLEAKGKGKNVVANIRTLFESTSMAVPSSYDDSAPLQTLSQAGAGLINVWNAIHYQSSVSPGELLLNDTTHFKGDHTIKITNSGNKAKVYTLTHVPTGTAITINNTFPNDYPVPLSGTAAQVTLSSKSIKINPGKTVPVLVHIAPPAGLDASTFPVYSGSVKIASDAGETLSVSYMGVAAALKDMHVIDNTDVTFGIPLPSLLGPDGNPQNNGSTYTFAKNNNTVDGPTLLYRLNAGTPRLAIDLVDSKINLQTTLKRSFDHELQIESHPIEKRDLFGIIWGLISGGKHSKPPTTSYDKIPTIGQIGLLMYQPRNSDATTAEDNGYATIAWDGTYANGTAAANGSYKILVRALRITGNPTDEKDYESWLSSEFTIKRS